MPQIAARDGARRALLLAGTLLLVGAATAVLFPPATAPPVPAAPGLLARLFPGVPAWWVLARLGALAAGALLVAAAVPGRAAWDATAAPGHQRPARRLRAPGAGPVAAVLAAVALVLAPWVGQIGPRGQLAYLLLLVAPPCVLLAGTARRAGAAPAARASRREALGVAALIGLWIAWRGTTAWHCLRAADAVDLWLGYQWLLRAATESRDLLTAPVLPGLTTRYMLFQGLWLYTVFGVAPSFRWVQSFQVLWCTVGAAALGRVAALGLGRGAPPVAVAVFLWSPFVLLMPLSATPFMLGGLFAAVLLMFWLAVDREGSPAALVALTTLAGFTVTLPPAAPIAGLTLALAAWSVFRRRDLPAWVLAAAVLGGLAALLPTLPSAATVQRMVESYAHGRGAWADLEAAVLGQRAPMEVEQAWVAGRAGPLDVPLASLLAPFAIPRTPLRLWGDTLFDPLGTTLAAVGLAVCVRDLRRRAAATGLLGLFALALLPGAAASSFDRPSLTRMFLLPVPMALLAAVGARAWLAAIGWRDARMLPRAVAAVVAAVVAGGTALFDVVTPRLLAGSAIGIALRAVADGGPPGGAVFLRHGHERASWLHFEAIATEVPRTPLPVRRFEGPQTLEAMAAAGGAGGPRVLLWSPGLEAEAGVSAAVCARWPGAALYTLRDAAGLAACLAACPEGDRWVPALPRRQWEARPCPAAARAAQSPGGTRSRAAGGGGTTRRTTAWGSPEASR